MTRFITVLVVALTVAIPIAAAYLGYHYGITHPPVSDSATTTANGASSAPTVTTPRL